MLMLFLFKEHPDQVFLSTLFLHQSLVLKIKERIVASYMGLGHAWDICLACHYITQQIELLYTVQQIMMYEINDIPRVDK